MKGKFLMNLLLTFIWVALTGAFALINYVFGFVLSFLIMWISDRNNQKTKYYSIVPQLISFIFFFIYELFKANLQVAWEVITPKNKMKPGIVKVPLTVTSDFEITLLANLITLTPGTLSLDISGDKKVLYVHAMYIHDRDAFIEGIKNGFEKRILDLTR
ncbi:MAG: Na+/H+ antiporter subunit E [Cyclobacteriaceae bacterium]|nr:Na+/H+ antiporter subunit E [Cyclobacteriaceae bacterium]